MEEYLRSIPDRVVFRPTDGAPDTDNEHFLVTELKTGGMIAFWTQSSCENFGNNHVVQSRSRDGKEWSGVRIIAGSKSEGGEQKQASWQFPVITPSGRIYLFYVQEGDKFDLDRASSGWFACQYSDDDGTSWSSPAILPMPRNRFDHTDPSVPKNWIVWQIPIRDCEGRVLVGYTHWTSPQHHNNPPIGWYSRDSRCRFFRLENIDEDPDPKDIQINWFEEFQSGLEVSYPGREDLSVAQEPSIVVLPDGRIFCVMRTFTGYIYWSVSADSGATWTKPAVLRECDGGRAIRQPIASCPIYRLKDGRYLLLHHNNDGHLGKYGPGDALNNRRPAFIRVGEFRPGAEQPVWFSDALQILDSDGVCIGPKQTCEIATYPSLTEYRGERTLWYPDRKFFLLGKLLPDSLLAGLSVPETTGESVAEGQSNADCCRSGCP